MVALLRAARGRGRRDGGALPWSAMQLQVAVALAVAALLCVGASARTAAAKGPSGEYCGSKSVLVFLDIHYRVSIDPKAQTFAITVEAPPVYHLPWCQNNPYTFSPKGGIRLRKPKRCMQELLQLLGGRMPTMTYIPAADGESDKIEATLSGIPVVGKESATLHRCDQLDDGDDDGVEL